MAYVSWLEARASNEGGRIEEKAMEAIRGGWYLGEEASVALLAAGVLAGIGLVAVGAIKTMQTGKSPVFSSLENLAFGLGGGVLAYFVGKAFDSLIAG